MDEDVSPLEREHSLSVMLPGGLEKNATVHGSKPVMDLLVTLCASYHLNPSEYTVEVLSPGNNNISFTPNSPIGLLEAEKIVLKPRAGEEKIRTPYMPEATVRLLINYNKSHKTVVRVNPRLPLGLLLPLVCDKCEFQLESTVLLRDCESKEPLDPRRSLNELGLREVYAKDTGAEDDVGHGQQSTADIAPTKVSLSSSLQDLTKKEKKKSENKGFLSLFRKHRKKSEPRHVVSAPSSPGAKLRSPSVSSQDVTSCTTPPADLRKKRRAPLPPMGASNSTPNNLSSCHLQSPQMSGDDTLKCTKRRAPQPPSATNHNKDTTEDSVISLEEVKESEETVSHPSPSSSLPIPPSPPALPSSLPPAPHLTHPLHKTHLQNGPSIQSKDLSDARAALAQVLTSSLTGGTLAKRLKNSSFSKTHNGTSSTCVSESDVEIKSVLCRNLPTENDFEDGKDRRGLTTYKVVPSRRQSDAEPVPDVLTTEEAEGAEGMPEPEQLDQVKAEPVQAETELEQADAELAQEEPNQFNQEQKKAEPESEQLASIDPESDQADPEPAQANLELGHADPEPAQADPEPAQAEPEPEKLDPVNPEWDQAETELEQADPEQAQADPEPDHADPEPAQADPEPNHADPEPAQADPEPNHADPEPAQADPEPNHANSELAQVEPDLAQTDPDYYTDPEPDHAYTEQADPELDQADPEPNPVKPDANQVDPEPEQVELDQGNPKEDASETETQQNNGEMELIIDHRTEALGRCHENSGLYLGEEEEVVECHTETCDPKDEQNSQEDDCFPPPPPPMFFNEDLAEADGVFVTDEQTCRSNSEPPKVNQAAETLQAVVSAPSRFAHAVALAVQRTRLHSSGKSPAVQQDT